MRVGQFGLFLAVVLSILTGWHYYLWVRLVRDPGWPAPYSRIGTGMVVALALSVPLALLGTRLWPNSVGRTASAATFVWFGLGFLLFASLLAIDLGALVWRAARWLSNAPPLDPARRLWFARAGAAAASAGSAVLGATAIRSALERPEIREVRVKLDRLPRALSGFTIVQLCDLHIGSTLGREFLEEVVERTNQQSPDAIVIVGDLVDGSVERLRDRVQPLARLRARHGVYFVTGNHEYYSGVEAWLAELPRLGVRVLRNERITLGDADASIDLAGVDDATAAGFGRGHGPNYEKALRGLAPDREVILLAHQPRQITGSAPFGIGLQLSGHTHGGQIWPFGGLVRLVEPYLAGLYRHNERTQIYVSRGTGFWGPPMRLRAPAEITKLILESD